MSSINRFLPHIDTQLAVVPICIKPTLLHNEIVVPADPEEIADVFKNTVLHSFLNPDQTHCDHFSIEVQGKIVDIPIPPISTVRMDIHHCYDSEDNFQYTTIRLPPIHAAVNTVLYNMSLGRQPRLDVLAKSVDAMLTNIVKTQLVSTTFPLGISGLFQGGDGFLKDGEVAITTTLAKKLIESLIASFYTKAAKSTSPGTRSSNRNRADMLRKRYEEKGVGILNGWKDVIVKREPAVSKGTMETAIIRVVNCPGSAIYITWKGIDRKGGDHDGDPGYIYDPSDPEGLKLLQHLLVSHPQVREKPILFHQGTTIARKKTVVDIHLGTVNWVPEDEKIVLLELKGKEYIGRTWYILWHYCKLFAFQKSYKDLNIEDLIHLNKKLSLIQEIVTEKPDSILAKDYKECTDKIFPNEWNFILFSQREWEVWGQLCYITMTESFVELYEIIFDLRKGTTKLPFSIPTVLDQLSGGKIAPNWEALNSIGIESRPMKVVWESLVMVNSNKSMTESIKYNKVWSSLVSDRKDWRGHSTQAKEFYSENINDFAEYIQKGLYTFV